MCALRSGGFWATRSNNWEQLTVRFAARS